jgi:hypothetical protein
MNRDLDLGARLGLRKRDRALLKIDCAPSEPCEVALPSSGKVGRQNQASPIALGNIEQSSNLLRREYAFLDRDIPQNPNTGDRVAFENPLIDRRDKGPLQNAPNRQVDGPRRPTTSQQMITITQKVVGGDCLERNASPGSKKAEEPDDDPVIFRITGTSNGAALGFQPPGEPLLDGDRLELFPGQASVTLLEYDPKLLFAGNQAGRSKRLELLPSINDDPRFTLIGFLGRTFELPAIGCGIAPDPILRLWMFPEGSYGFTLLFSQRCNKSPCLTAVCSSIVCHAQLARL